MAEQLVNEFTVNRPIDEAWAVITDVERIAPCLPGAQLQEIEGEIYRGVVKIKLGSITPAFKGQATFIERDDTAHKAVLKAEGRDTGGRGNASAEIEAQAESLSPTSTRVVVTTDLHITGKVAQFGRGIIGDVSKKLMAQFAGNLNTMLDEQPASGAEPAAAAASADCRPGVDGRAGRARRGRRRPVAGGERARRRHAARRGTGAGRGAQGAQDRQPGERAGRPRRRRRAGDPQAAGPGRRRAAAPRVHPAPPPLTGRPTAVRRAGRRAPGSGRCSDASRRARSRSSRATTTATRSSSATPPFLDDGTPMPTRYWLVGPREVLAVSRLEAAGGVQAGRGRDRSGGRRRRPRPLRRRARRRRRRRTPAVAPSGGVGGTRQGVKCLHAHYAWFLAGGDDPVGRWVERRLRTRLDVEVGPSSTSFSHAGRDLRIPVGPDLLLRTDLVDPDPADAGPADERHRARRRPRRRRAARGARPPSTRPTSTSVVTSCGTSPSVERGAPPSAPSVVIERDAAEEVFRALATESRAARLHNPGLDPARVDSVLAASCVLVGLMRRLQLDAVTIEAA